MAKGDKTKTEETTAVAVAQNTALAEFDYGEDAGAGFENQDSSHVSIPFINLLQALSPAVSAEDSVLRPGMLMNSVTNDIYPAKEGFTFVPCEIKHCFVEWVPKDLGGGLVAVHEIDSDVVKKAKDVVKKAKDTAVDRNKLKVGTNELIETFYMYGVLCDGETPVGPAIIAFTSTKIKKYRGWNTKVNMFPHKKHGMPAKPPLYAHLIRVTAAKEKSPKGEFYNFELAPAVDAEVLKSLLRPNDPRFVMAKDVREMVRSGMAKAAYDTAAPEGGVGGGSAGESRDIDGEIPF